MGKQVGEKELKFDLPWPPSINRYYRTYQGRMLISKDGREYRARVAEELDGVEQIPGRLSVEIHAFPPDRRRRDLDNIQKALLDSIEHAGVIEDDANIDYLLTIRKRIVQYGSVTVCLRQFSATD
jgi:crossover junction endodeoxyribonuclease RusA